MEGLLKREETQAWREKTHSFSLILKPTPDDVAPQTEQPRKKYESVPHKHDAESPTELQGQEWL